MNAIPPFERLALVLACGTILGFASNGFPATRDRHAEGARQFRYVDAKKNMTILAHGGRADQVDSKTDVLVLNGNVSIASASQGLTLKAARVKCITSPDAEGRNEVRQATATGGVHLVKSVTVAGAAQLTDIRGAAGELAVEPTGDVVHLNGPVRIESVNGERRQTMVATGSSAVVTLEPTNTEREGNGLREGRLTGPVQVVLVAAPAKGASKFSHVVATGDRMEFSNHGLRPEIVMSGHVDIHGEAEGTLGHLTGLSRATLRLNQALEVVGWEAGS